MGVLAGESHTHCCQYIYIYIVVTDGVFSTLAVNKQRDTHIHTSLLGDRGGGGVCVCCVL